MIATRANRETLFLDSLQSPVIAFPIFLAGVGVAAASFYFGYAYYALLAIVALFLLIPNFLSFVVYPVIARFTKKRRLQPLFALGMVLGLISALAFGVLVHPADAQFFTGTENFVNNKLLAGIDNADALKKIFAFIINIIRFLFILYMVFSVVSVIQALRRDEDWGKLAQVPLMVFVAATVTDIAAGFILPK